MIIISNRPPACYDRLHKEFGVRWESGIIITYAGVIHCAAGDMSPDFLAHEMVHVVQQDGIDPEEYLERYITDREFRKASEAGAYRVQAAFLDATVEDPDLCVAKKTKLLKSMMTNYGDIFTIEESKNILGL